MEKTSRSKITACCLYLINAANETKSKTLKVTEEGVTIGNEKIGDWEITIRKKNG